MKHVSELLNDLPMFVGLHGDRRKALWLNREQKRLFERVHQKTLALAQNPPDPLPPQTNQG
jgi:hypothetical protein